VSIAGVSDLVEFLKEKRSDLTAERSAIYVYWQVSIGELGKDDAALNATSPALLADRIKIPVLLIHGTNDWIVPHAQSELMARALERAGRSVELELIDGATHGFNRTDWRAKMNQRTAAFVDARIGVKP
jgi:dipeptidyl aminopeptidase/acylaminoacyl peptidase